MIEFQRRTLPCWEVCEDYDRAKTIPVLTFINIPELVSYIKSTISGDITIVERENLAFYDYQVLQDNVVVGMFRKFNGTNE